MFEGPGDEGELILIWWMFEFHQFDILKPWAEYTLCEHLLNTPSDLCVSSLRIGPANLFCIVLTLGVYFGRPPGFSGPRPFAFFPPAFCLRRLERDLVQEGPGPANAGRSPTG